MYSHAGGIGGLYETVIRPLYQDKNMPGQLQRDVLGMGGARDGPSGCHPAAGVAAGVLGFLVTVAEVLHFRRHVESDGGGARAWVTLSVALLGVFLLCYDAAAQPPGDRLGSGAIKLMAALVVAHAFVPLLAPPPTAEVGYDDDDSDDADAD
jgi:hypothetical protein